MSTHLGPFKLIAPFARGGMAEVWHATHEAQQVPVAIKVMTGAHSQDPNWVARFRDEVRAVAGLDHPNLVMILDHGHIPEDVARRFPKRLQAGAPWLAMEYASGGTLTGLPMPLRWHEIFGLLKGVLDGLAHAHARGLVHRDLKPSNVLISPASDLRPGVKLTDFGIAYAGRRVEDGPMGTPSYMSPEQIENRWRDFCPGTDLYSLGCLGWWLATGRTPFRAPRVPDVLMGHLYQPLPSFHPAMKLPEGFEDWLRKLLQKHPDQRFLRAADAVHALQQLGEATGEAPSGIPLAPDLSMALTLTQDTLPAMQSAHTEPLWATEDAATEQIHAPTAKVFPASWRTPQSSAPPQLVGAGQSLYGLRAVPLIGRDEPLDKIWRALSKVHRTGRAQGLLIHGPAGTGKSRLVQWLGQRADELGVAHRCNASFSPQLPPGEALRLMGLNWLTLKGLSPVDSAERTHDRLGALGCPQGAELDIITTALSPDTESALAEGQQQGGLENPREYYAATRGAMYWIAQQRPLIAWFDDVQWGQHGLGLALQILATQDERPFPCLILMTLRDEDLEEESATARQIHRLVDEHRVPRLHLGPLPPEEQGALVRALLGVEDSLARSVVERTDGNPLFATQLVGDWVQRGLLEPGPEGYRLRDGATANLPDDLHALWWHRLKNLLSEFAPQAQNYLEIAAIIGLDVSRKDWRAACDDPRGFFGDRFPGDEGLRSAMVERLLGQRLIVGTHRRWRFVHGMLRESLVRVAREQHRLADHHLACAQVLEQSEDPRDRERLGIHLLGAKRADAAILPLLDGARMRLRNTGAESTAILLSKAERALVRANAPKTDSRWALLWTLQARVSREQGALDQAMDLSTKALEAAQRNAGSKAEREAMRYHGELLLERGDLTAATAQFRVLSERFDEARVRSAALVGLAEVDRKRGNFMSAKRQLKAAQFLLQTDDQGGDELANIWRLFGRCDESLGETEDARKAYTEAMTRYQALKLAAAVADCEDRLARMDQERGDLPAAAAGFRSALTRFDAVASDRAFSTRMRLALVHAAIGDLDLAWKTVDRIKGITLHMDHDGQLATARSFRLLRYALDRDWPAFDTTFAESVQRLPQRGLAPVVIAWLTHVTAHATRHRGEKERAAHCFRATAGIWSAMGQLSRAAQAMSALQELSDAPSS